METKTSFCITTSLIQAGQIIELLKDEGFSDGEISVLFPNKACTLNTNGNGPEWMTGAAALDVYEVGPLVAIGPIIAIFSGETESPDRLGKALVNLGIPAQEAHHYETNVKEGSILIAVPAKTTEKGNLVSKIFEKLSAAHVSTKRDIPENKPA